MCQFSPVRKELSECPNTKNVMLGVYYFPTALSTSGASRRGSLCVHEAKDRQRKEQGIVIIKTVSVDWTQGISALIRVSFWITSTALILFARAAFVYNCTHRTFVALTRNQSTSMHDGYYSVCINIRLTGFRAMRHGECLSNCRSSF